MEKELLAWGPLTIWRGENIPKLSTRETVENWIRRKIGSFKASGKELLTSRDSSVYSNRKLIFFQSSISQSRHTSLRSASKKFMPE